VQISLRHNATYWCEILAVDERRYSCHAVNSTYASASNWNRGNDFVRWIYSNCSPAFTISGFICLLDRDCDSLLSRNWKEEHFIQFHSLTYTKITTFSEALLDWHSSEVFWSYICTFHLPVVNHYYMIGYGLLFAYSYANGFLMIWSDTLVYC